MEECASREVLKNPSGKARLGKFCKLVDDNMDERPHGWGSPISLQFNSAEAMQVALRPHVFSQFNKAKAGKVIFERFTN